MVRAGAPRRMCCAAAPSALVALVRGHGCAWLKSCCCVRALSGRALALRAPPMRRWRASAICAGGLFCGRPCVAVYVAGAPCCCQTCAEPREAQGPEASERDGVRLWMVAARARGLAVSSGHAAVAWRLAPTWRRLWRLPALPGWSSAAALARQGPCLRAGEMSRRRLWLGASAPAAIGWRVTARRMSARGSAAPCAGVTGCDRSLPHAWGCGCAGARVRRVGTRAVRRQCGAAHSARCGGVFIGSDGVGCMPQREGRELPWTVDLWAVGCQPRGTSPSVCVRCP